MDTNMKSEFNKSLDIQDEEIAEFIPYILQDLWSLGGNPDVVVKIVKRNITLTPDSRIIDLGCGKGATLIELAKTLQELVDLSPRGIREHLHLSRPVYERTAAYGHFGREPDADGGFSWEKTDLAGELKSAFGAA